MRKDFLIVFLLLPLLIFTAGCSKKTSFTYKTYHDITHRYNYYFNAKLIYNLNVRQAKKTGTENYNELLPLSPAAPTAAAPSATAGVTAAPAANPELDKVIKKSSVGIQIHDNSKWVDDSYLFIGKANYMKGNFEEALKAFQHITAEYDEGIRRVEKKGKASKRNRKQKRTDENIYYNGFLSFMKHKPSRYEAMIWIIKSYTALNKFTEAHSVVALVQADKTFPEVLRDDLELAVTEMYLQQGNYQYAAQALEKAIKLTDKKKEKRRYHFILAQLHQRNNNYTSAINNYEEVLDMQPDYEMEFYAKINIAKISREQNLKSNAQIIALLRDMLKNDKYKEFQGDIYFTLAEIYHSETDMEKAIDNYKKSVQNTIREEQKSRAYLQLAEIYFNSEKYILSKAYYDSTLIYLPQENVRYEEISSRSVILKDLVEQINIINKQDSLQNMAKMTDTEIEALLQAKRDAKKAEAEAATSPNDQISLLNDPSQQQIATSWPFDNVSQRSRGFSEFRKLWGDRPLENNWRRSDKQSLADLDPAFVEEGVEPIAPEEMTVADFKKTLPISQEQMRASDEKIINAYYKLGSIYKENLENEPKAAETFETLLNRYPQNKYRVQMLYQLYLFNKDINPSLAANYKNALLKEYPDHILAKVVENPNYMTATQQQQNQVSTFYATTYEFFERDNYQQVLQRKKIADTLYAENPLKPQFDMLEALTYGKQGKMDSFRVALETIVNKYPLHEVKTQALAILNAMEGVEYKKEEVQLTDKKYTFDEKAPHFAVVAFEKIKPVNNDVQNNLAAYLDKYYSLEKLKLNPVLLDNETQIFVIKQFPNAAKAMAFYNQVRYNPEVFKGLEKEDYKMFIVTERNYGVFFREKDVAEYLNYFSQYYLNKK